VKALTAARALAARVGSRLVSSPTTHEPPLVVVFSADGALRLELFLRSYAQQLSTPLPLTVLCHASTDAHRQAYEAVFAGYRASELTAIGEGAFKPALLAVLKASNVRHVIFFEDDMVFVQPVDSRLLEQWEPGDGILSLRLGRNITRSQGRGGIEQPQPAQLEGATLGDQTLVRWRWSAGALDWAQPASLAGHLLPLPDLVPVIEQARFETPGSLEVAIGQYQFLFKGRWGYCWEHSRVMSLVAGARQPESAELQLDAFRRGLRLDISQLPLAQHDSCQMHWEPALQPAADTSQQPGGA